MIQPTSHEILFDNQSATCDKCGVKTILSTVCRARRSQEQTFLRDSFSQPGAAPFSKLSASKPRGRGEVYRFYSHRTGKVEQWPHTTGMLLLSLQPIAKQASWDHSSSGNNKNDAETRLEGNTLMGPISVEGQTNALKFSERRVANWCAEAEQRDKANATTRRKPRAETFDLTIHYPSPSPAVPVSGNAAELSWVGGSHPAGIPECMPQFNGSPKSHWILGVTLQTLAGSRPERRNCRQFKANGRSEAPAEPRTGRRNRPEKNSETGANLTR